MSFIENIENRISDRIKKNDILSPFLFIWNNLDLVNAKVYDLAINIMKEHNVWKFNLYKLEDNNDSIKIWDIKDFLYPSQILPDCRFQIFLIENISRFTLEASNSCLKFFEESGPSNIIFLTNRSESFILDTVLSRLEKIYFYEWDNFIIKDNFFYSLIEKTIAWDFDIIAYFYKTKIEEENIIKFLRNILLFSKENFLLIEYLDDLFSDIEAIIRNNINAKFVLDKWILKLILFKDEK